MLISGKIYLLTTDEYFYAPNVLSYRAVWGRCFVHNFQENFTFPAKGHANFFVVVGSETLEDDSVLIAGCRINYAFACEKPPVLLQTNSVMAKINDQIFPYYYNNVLIINDKP